MKIFKQPGYTTVCGTADEWEELKKPFLEETGVSVLDLRRAGETNALEKMPDSWTFRRLPISGGTISEQDVDVFRREQRRHGRLIVVAPNSTRGELLVLVDRARIDRTPLPEEQLRELRELDEEKELREWLDRYLERHQSTELGELEQ